VGLDNIDLDFCKERNVVVGWTGGVNKESVAEMALGFMIALTRNLFSTSNQLKQLTWNKSGGYTLCNKTVGIIGFGNIGRQVSEFVRPFHCEILVNDIVDISRSVEGLFTNQVGMDVLLANTVFISIHTPLTSLTKGMITKEFFHKMKPTACLINTARGGIVNEEDLKYALVNNVIAGAALDVYENEPPVDRDLLTLPNLICTPHTGGNAYEAVVAMGESAINHLKEYKNRNNL
jgi:D-3-phosphoglycerate dehydrogenase